MIEELRVCFALEDKVENMTELHKKLVDSFGIGGMVERNIDGQVVNFRVLFEYGTIALNTRNNVLQLDVKEVITSEQIQDLYKKLKDAVGVTRWYLKKQYIHEI